MKQLLFLLFSALILPYAKGNAYSECRHLYTLPKRMDLQALNNAAHEKQCEPLIQAVQATKALYAAYKHPGIKQRRFLQTALYLEMHLPKIKSMDKPFLTKKHTHLKHTLEHDPVTGHTFIVLDSKKAYIGKGKKKTVYKSILYQPQPKVVARGEQYVSMDHELAAHKALQGHVGLMKTYAFTTHMDKNKKYTTIYSDLYQGTIKELLEKNNLSFRNKLIIMHDVLKGVESIHANNFVHRDLHSHNYLLSVHRDPNGKKVIHAVVADLGRTIDVNKAKKVPAQGARFLCPPEGFHPKKLKGEAYFATDIYALGSIFYRIYHNELPRWQSEYLKDDDLSTNKKQKMLLTKLKKHTSKRRRFLSRQLKKGTLTVQEDLELMILKMVRKDPAKRGTVSQWRHELERIMHRVHK